MMRQPCPVCSFNWVECRRQGECIRVLLQRGGFELSNSDGGGVDQREKERKSDHPDGFEVNVNGSSQKILKECV